MKKLFALLTCLVSLLSAAQPVFNENRFALIIGLSEYENKNIQILVGFSLPRFWLIFSKT